MDKKWHVPRVESLKIPDDDAQNWIRQLGELGFSAEEIENIMIKANDTYASVKFRGDLEDGLSKYEKLLNKLGWHSDEETKEAARRAVLEDLREKFFGSKQK